MKNENIETEVTLGFEEKNDSFVLVKTDSHKRRTQLELNEAEVMFLPRVTQDAIQLIVSRRMTQNFNQQGIIPSIAVTVSEIQINTDIHHSEILLRFTDQFGNQTGFALPCNVAEDLVQHLSKYIGLLKNDRRVT